MLQSLIKSYKVYDTYRMQQTVSQVFYSFTSFIVIKTKVKYPLSHLSNLRGKLRHVEHSNDGIKLGSGQRRQKLDKTEGRFFRLLEDIFFPSDKILKI